MNKWGCLIMKLKSFSLDKRTSSFIKGIAIVMMVYHHFYAFSERILIDNAYFRFLTGGGDTRFSWLYC